MFGDQSTRNFPDVAVTRGGELVDAVVAATHECCRAARLEHPDQLGRGHLRGAVDASLPRCGRAPWWGAWRRRRRPDTRALPRRASGTPRRQAALVPGLPPPPRMLLGEPGCTTVREC